MLISRRLMFIHYPRTGGASVQHHLRQSVPDTYYPLDDLSLNDSQKSWIMHQGIDVGFRYAQERGIDPLSLPALVIIRNPYSLALSGFMYLNQRWKSHIDDLENNFLDYLRNLDEKTSPEKKTAWAHSRYGQYTDYLLVNGEQPPNLTIARTESLQKDVRRFLIRKVGVRPNVKFPHRNASEHKHFSTYYTAAEEELVYGMWKNAFEAGLYKRYEGLDRSRL